MAHVSTLPAACPNVDWASWNRKPETLALIKDAGGLTPLMAAFQDVYERSDWGCGSGDGSSLDFAARTICVLSRALPELLGVTLLVDLPCGDQQWAPTLRSLVPGGIKYIGVDAMPGLVQRNLELFSDERTTFVLAQMDAPGVFERIRSASRGLWTPADRVAVLSRHVLEHNALPAIHSYLASLRASGVEFLIGTNSNVPTNPDAGDLETAGYVPVRECAPQRGVGALAHTRYCAPVYSHTRPSPCRHR